MPEPETEIAAPSEIVFKPTARAFFVYFVALALVVLGPRLNPEVGLPIWLGNLLGIIIVAVLIYQKYGTEYQITSQGVARIWRWPSLRRQEIPWEDLGEVVVLRGLTQTVLQVGNLALADKSGKGNMFWYGLPHPNEVKEEIDRMRP